MLLQFISRIQFPQIKPTEVVPVTILVDQAPVITKVTATPPAKKVTHKKITPAPKIKTATAQLPTKLSGTINSSSETTASLTFDTVPPTESSKPVTQVAPALLSLPPPSASYLLDVIRTESHLANPYYGSGKIRWNHDNKNYTMHIEIGIDMLFTTVRLYKTQSEGTIEEAGIKPHTVTETRRGKSATTTRFNYDDQTISFSTNPAIIPLTEGAQDKITVLMQLASIGNADPSQFQPGKEITIQVAEEKEAHLHQFVVLDQETIESKLGHLVTWHIVRPPRPGVYSSRIDIWLAPELNWLPVQIRNTESNGAVTTQTIRQIIEE